MKIGIFINGFTTRIAGGDYHATRVARIWAKDHDVSVFMPRSGVSWVGHLLAPAKVSGYDTPLEQLVLNGVSGGIRVAIAYLLRIIVCSLQPSDVDVLVASSHYPQDVIPAILHHLRKRKAPVVVYVHGISIPRMRGVINFGASLVYNYVGFLLTRIFAGRVLTVGQDTACTLISLGFRKHSIVPTSNGLDTPTVYSKRKEFDGCFMGRLAAEKGVKDLPRVWRKVADHQPGSKLLIIGSGPELKAIRAKMHDLGLQSDVVVFHEAVLGNERFELITRARVFVFPSYIESWGIAVGEAIACGVPVIAYDLRAYGEVYGEVLGSSLTTVPVGDINLMASKILELLRNPVPEPRLIADSKKVLEKYEWSRIAQRELDALVMCVRSSQPKV
jgi:glycosyltransferase involved in cell wall biosynthesis